MDAERDKLVAALRKKLTELDSEVVAYRRERADEFRRYATDLLKPFSDSVTTEVADLVEGPSSTTSTDFAALYPGFLDAGNDKSILAPPLPSRAQARRTISPPPVLYHTSGVPKEGPRRPLTSESVSSLHSRDEDVQRLFTPSFLPLLDHSSSYHRPQSIEGVYNGSIASDTAAAEASAAADLEAAATAAVAASAAEEAEARAAAATPPVPPAPAEPKLKSVLRRTSSISSSRSSTPTIKSPPTNTRHVRFSFGDKEVLPTASPPKYIEQDLSWMMHEDSNRDYDDMDYENAGIQPDYVQDDMQSGILEEDGMPERAAGKLFGAEQHGPESAARGGSPQGSESQSAAQISSTAPFKVSDSDPVFQRDTSQMQSQTAKEKGQTTTASPPSPSTSADRPPPRRRGSKILDDDDEDNFAPLSRRISSSDKLRALSKMPLEDPSLWTVVSPAGSGTNTTPSVTDVISTHHQRRLSLQLGQEQLPTVEQVEYSQGPQAAQASSTHGGYSSSSDDDDDDDDDDDEGFIAMRPTRKQSLSLPSPPAEASAPAPNGTATEASDEGKNADVDTSRPKKSTWTGKAVQVQFADSVIGEDNHKPRPQPRSKAGAVRDGDDDFFAFEDDGGEPSIGYPLCRTQHVDKDEDEDSHSEDDEEPDETGVEAEEAEAEAPINDADLVEKEKAALGIGNDGLDSSSLAFNHRKILGAAASQGGGINVAASSSGSLTPPGPPLGASVGSYRGRNLDLFSVVKDPRVLQEAEQLGEVDSFVGSIHDGHQPSTMAEFSSLTGSERLNLMSGTPRSLTERMIMEEIRKNLMSPSARHR